MVKRSQIWSFAFVGWDATRGVGSIKRLGEGGTGFEGHFWNKKGRLNTGYAARHLKNVSRKCWRQGWGGGEGKIKAITTIPI